MKQLTILLGLICLSVSARAQFDASHAIQQRLNEYFEATKAKDWPKVVDLLYPKLFTLMEKKDMVQLFQDMEGNGVEFEMKTFELRRVSNAYVHEGEAFALVDYSALMNIRFTSEAYKDTSITEMIRQNYIASYGAENVQYLAEDNSFDIRSEKALFAIAPEDSDDWSFMESDPGQESLIASFIPEEIREKLQMKE